MFRSHLEAQEALAKELPMGLRSFLAKAAALSAYDRLQEQINKNMQRGLDATEASALLVLQEWRLPQTIETIPRSVAVAMGLGEPRWVIGMLIFTRRAGLSKRMGQSLLQDSFFSRHGVLYEAVVPFTDFARPILNVKRDEIKLDSDDVRDAAFAEYYASRMSPIAVDAWLMLAQLRNWGFNLECDQRDHCAEGVAACEEFLRVCPNADMEFCSVQNLAHPSVKMVRTVWHGEATT